MTPTFYMSKSQNPVPAAGLYYYTTELNEKSELFLREHIVGFDGKPALHPNKLVRNTISLKDVFSPLKYTLAGDDDLVMGKGNWMIEVPNNPGAYLTLFSLKKPFPKYIWTGLLEKKNSDSDIFFLLPNVRLSMINILKDRYDYGYYKIPNRIRDNAGMQKLVDNLDPFWECLRLVGKGLIRAVEANFQEHASLTDQPVFKNSDLIFHMNRILCESYIEGHARFGLTETRNFIVNEYSIQDWFIMLRCISNDLQNKFTQPWDHEEIVINKVRKCVEKELSEVNFIFRILIKLLLFLFNYNFFDAITPGKTEQQILVFWGMHYPHWFKDLYYVLNELAKVNVFICEEDISSIAYIIVSALKRSVIDSRTVLAAKVVGIAGDVFLGKDPTLQIVKGILTEINNSVFLTCPCRKTL